MTRIVKTYNQMQVAFNDAQDILDGIRDFIDWQHKELLRLEKANEELQKLLPFSGDDKEASDE